MNQLLLGAAIGFFPCAAWYGMRRGSAGLHLLITTPLLMSACALWAVVPDIPRIMGMTDLYLQWSRNPKIDIFFWHYSIDLMEADSPWYAVGIVLLYAIVMAAAWGELRRTERGRTWPT